MWLCCAAAALEDKSVYYIIMLIGDMGTYDGMISVASTKAERVAFRCILYQSTENKYHWQFRCHGDATPTIRKMEDFTVGRMVFISKHFCKYHHHIIHRYATSEALSLGHENESND